MHKYTLSHAKSVRSFDGTEIYYEVGKGHTDSFLVFLHGLGGDLTAWSKETVALQKFGYSTIAVDLRGHGLSDRPKKEDDYTIENIALDIIYVLKKEKILQRCVLIGHSLGGMVALAAQGNAPNAAKSLILIDSNFKPTPVEKFLSHQPIIKAMTKFLAEHGSTSHVASRANYGFFVGTGEYNPIRIASDILHTSLKSYISAWENGISFNGTALLKNISVSTLIISGLNDTVFPPEAEIEFWKRLKNAQIDFVPNANHIIVLNNPKDVVSEIHKFLKKTHFPSSSN